MAKPLSRVLDDVRAFLNDRVQPYRYSDADLTQYVDDGLRTMYRVRPDFVLAGRLPPVPVSEVPDFISEEGYYAALCEYVVGRAQMRDDQYVDEGYSALIHEKLRVQLLGTGV